MNKELTTEQKARVFAQYIGQQAQHDTAAMNGRLVCVDVRANRVNVVWPLYTSWANEPKLLLRPLSAISDEDAVEVAKILCADRIDAFAAWDIKRCPRTTQVTYLFHGKKQRLLIYNERLGFTVNDYKHDYDAGLPMQYLVQRGYAVPLFIAPGHPLNGKTAIEMGLAIDSTSINQ